MLEALDKIVAEVGGRADFASAEYTVDGTINVAFTEASRERRIAVASLDVVQDDGSVAAIPVHETLGSRPIPAVAPYDPEFVSAGAPYMGGDRCHNALEAYQGTLGFFSSHMTFEQSGQCNVVFDVTRGFVSNNHVLARSDRAKLGEPIWIDHLDNKNGKLTHKLPLSCNADLAFAAALDWSTVRSQQIRGIGWLRCTEDGYLDVRMPELGESILKYGITTGLTAGIVEAIVSFTAESGHEYRGIYRSSRGFTCPGDSGSIVVSEENAVLGVIAWGSSRKCSDDPYGFFFPLVRKRRAGEDDVPTLEARYEGDPPQAVARKAAVSALGGKTDTGVLEFEQFHLGPESHPQGLARDAHGSTWFSCEPSTIGRIRPDGARELHARDDGGSPLDVVLGKDGNVWFGDTARNCIGRITPGGAYVEPDIALPKRFLPTAGVAGADDRMWFCSSRLSLIAAVGADGQTQTYFGSQARGLVARRDHLVCLASSHVRQWGYDGEPGTIFMLPDGSNAFGLVDGRDGEVWFIDHGRGVLCRFAEGDGLTDFEVPAVPMAIAVTADGSVWGTLDGAVASDRKVMRLMRDGRLTVFPGPHPKSAFLNMIAGEQGDLWFSDHARGKIVRASVAG